MRGGAASRKFRRKKRARPLSKLQLKEKTSIKSHNCQNSHWRSSMLFFFFFPKTQKKHSFHDVSVSLLKIRTFFSFLQKIHKFNSFLNKLINKSVRQRAPSAIVSSYLRAKTKRKKKNKREGVVRKTIRDCVLYSWLNILTESGICNWKSLLSYGYGNNFRTWANLFSLRSKRFSFVTANNPRFCERRKSPSTANP